MSFVFGFLSLLLLGELSHHRGVLARAPASGAAVQLAPKLLARHLGVRDHLDAALAGADGTEAVLVELIRPEATAHRHAAGKTLHLGGLGGTDGARLALGVETLQLLLQLRGLAARKSLRLVDLDECLNGRHLEDEIPGVAQVSLMKTIWLLRGDLEPWPIQSFNFNVKSMLCLHLSSPLFR